MSADTRPKSAIELLIRVRTGMDILSEFADLWSPEGIQRFAYEEKKRLDQALELLSDDGR